MRRWDEALEVAATPDEALRAVAEVVSGLRRADARWAGPGLLTVDEAWRPWWTFVVAVVLFPVGLVALVHIRRERLLVSAEGRGRGAATLVIEGTATAAVSDAVWAAVEILVDVEEPAERG